MLPQTSKATHIRREKVRGPYTVGKATFAVLEEIEIDVTITCGVSVRTASARPLMVAVRVSDDVRLYRLEQSAAKSGASTGQTDALLAAISPSPPPSGQ